MFLANKYWPFPRPFLPPFFGIRLNQSSGIVSRFGVTGHYYNSINFTRELCGFDGQWNISTLVARTYRALLSSCCGISVSKLIIVFEAFIRSRRRFYSEIRPTRRWASVEINSRLVIMVNLKTADASLQVILIFAGRLMLFLLRILVQQEQRTQFEWYAKQLLPDKE